MRLRKTHHLLRLANQFHSHSHSDIRAASTPQQALNLYRTRLQLPNLHDNRFDSHAVVFAVKACSRLFSANTHLLPHLHAHTLKSGLLSHVHVATLLLHSYAQAHAPSSLADARRLFDEIPNRNIVTENTMITCYSNHGDINLARSLFNSMHERDIASWSTMIAAYMNRGYSTHGMAMFREMMRAGVCKPDGLVLVTLLSGCASAGSLMVLGKSIHAYCIKHGIEITDQLGTALIHMYAKSGCLKSVCRVFERMSVRTVIHWSAVIYGMALHGYGTEAITFFEEMRKAGLKPNAITFTGVLSACCHAGLVDEGHKYFCTMVEEFRYEPSIHHYGCMVDLFAKAGRLEEAHEVIRNMNVEPNMVMWSAFLSACRNQKAFRAAEPVLEKVLQIAIAENNGGVYTLISDLYALGGRWNDVQRVRKLMDENCVKKSRGSSFIEVEETRNRSQN